MICEPSIGPPSTRTTLLLLLLLLLLLRPLFTFAVARSDSPGTSGVHASFFFLAAYRVPVMASYYLRCRPDGRDALFTLGSASIPDETPLIDPGINGTDTPPLCRLNLRAGVKLHGQLKNVSVTVNHFNCRASHRESLLRFPADSRSTRSAKNHVREDRRHRIHSPSR